MKPAPESEATRFRGNFVTTHWSVVLKAGDGVSPLAAEALEQLCRHYWFPLYVYVRRQGFMPPEAQDITQGFFHQLIEKEFLKDVDPGKGRFRSFLLAAIKHYILNQRKHAGRLKRGGDQVMVPFDAGEAETRFRAEPATESTAERAFDRRWAMTVMELGLQRLGNEFVDAGKEPLFLALKKFVATEAEPGEYGELAPGLGLTKSGVGVAVHRLRQRYGELIRAEIANTVAQPLEVDEEMRYLLGLLADR
jgi:RNA polymerase sigma-70 factor (ECF subfamily)